MANQEDPICKYNNIKVDDSIKNNNGTKSRSWDKSGTNKKNTKEDGQRLVEVIQE